MFKSFKVDNARRVEFEDKFIQIPKSKWAYLRNNIDTLHSTGGEGTPSEPIDIVNVSSWNKTVCGENLFKVGTASDYNTAVTIDGNSISATIEDGNSKRFVNKTYYPNKEMYISSVFTIAEKRHLIRVYDRNKINISNTITIAGWTYVAYYGGLFKDSDTAIDLTANANVAFIQIGFVLKVNDTNVGQTGTVSDIMLTLGSAVTNYKHYTGNNYPYRLEDTNGVLHYGGDLPDGTADEVDWDNYLLQPRVKRIEVTSGTVPFIWDCQYTIDGVSRIVCYDTDNAWSTQLNTTHSTNIRCNIAKAGSTNVIGNVSFYRQANRTLIYLYIPALSADTDTAAQNWINAQIALHGNIVFEYEYSTPQTPIAIKQYGETYGGVVWDKNEKPIQVEDSVCNVFSDKNVKMKFKAVSY